MKIKYIFLLLLFSAIFCVFYTANVLLAQNKMPDKSAYYRFGSNFYTEIYATPNASLDSLTFYFFYKIAYEELVFQLKPDRRYFSVANVDASFKDANGIIRKRIVTNDTIYAKDYDETISKSTYFVNLIKFSVVNSNYDITTKLLDTKSFGINNIEKNIKNYNLLAKNSEICEPYFVGRYSRRNATDANYEEYLPLISNSFIPFSASAEFSILLPISFNNSANSIFEYKITDADKNKKIDERKKIWGDFETLAGTANILKNKTISADFENNKPRIKLQDILFEANNSVSNLATNPASNLATNSASNLATNLTIGLLKIDVNSNKFFPGYYELAIKNVRTNEEVTFPFEVRWADIPLSLLNAEYAADLMYYVLNDDEFREIKRGNKEERYKKIINYWKNYLKNSNTQYSETPYNKALATYFERADYAFFNFQTITSKDGAKTDRGKIYILYGKPDVIENDVHNGINCEIWYYKRHNQKFVYDIVSVGNYKLVKVEDISE